MHPDSDHEWKDFEWEWAEYQIEKQDSDGYIKCAQCGTVTATHFETCPRNKPIPVKPRTVPGQWCGNCGLVACYADDYICDACRENLYG